MAKHFWTILLAICYLVLFVALFFLFVSDNFYSYKNYGKFIYFSYIPFGMFVVCALAVYVLSAFMRFISARVSVAIVLGFAVAWIVVLSDANLFCGRGIHKSFMLSMWALSMVFLAGAPAMLAACALSIAESGRARRSWVVCALAAAVFAYFCAMEMAGMALFIAVGVGIALAVLWVASRVRSKAAR